VSIRLDGAEPPVILVTAKATLTGGPACLILTVTEESGNLWRYNLSEQGNNRLAYGKIIMPGHMAALRRAAEICADGYQPGSTPSSHQPPLQTCHKTRQYPRTTAKHRSTAQMKQKLRNR
jgi:hypothetical protein